MALFVPLDVSYAQDPKVLDLDDERAELLFIRSLAYCKAHLTDGLVHRKALSSIAPFVDEVQPSVLAAELVRVGLWVEADRGWRVVAWLKHNAGSDEILTPNSAREMAHKRHHANKGVAKEGCPFCFPVNPQVAAHDAMRTCDADAVRHVPEPEPETEPQSEAEPTNPPPVSGLLTTPLPGPRPADNVEQMVNKAVGIVARHRARDGENPAALAAAIGRSLPDVDRDELCRLIVTGLTPEDAARVVADPMWVVGRENHATGADPLARPPLPEFVPAPAEPAADPTPHLAAVREQLRASRMDVGGIGGDDEAVTA